jgi:hypothetical protein
VSEPTETVGPPEHREVSKLDQVVRRLADSGTEAVIWRSFQGLAHAVSPGLGVAVKGLHIGINLYNAVRSYEQGKGILLGIPMVDIGDGYSVKARLRVCAVDPPPTPPVELAFDYASVGDTRLDKVDVVNEADQQQRDEAVRRHRDTVADLYERAQAPREPAAVRRTAPVGGSIEALLQHTQQQAQAARTRGDNWSTFATTYIDPQTRRGWTVLQTRDEAPLCPLWLQIERVAPAGPTVDDPKVRCPRCGKAILTTPHTCDDGSSDG